MQYEVIISNFGRNKIKSYYRIIRTMATHCGAYYEDLLKVEGINVLSQCPACKIAGHLLKFGYLMMMNLKLKKNLTKDIYS